MCPSVDPPEKAGRVDRLLYTARFRLPRSDDIFLGIAIEYRPVVDGTSRDDLSASFYALDSRSPAWVQFTTLLKMLELPLEPQPVLIDGQTYHLYDEIEQVEIRSDSPQIWLFLRDDRPTIPIIDAEGLTPSQRSLFASIKGSLDRLAWDDFRTRLGMSGAQKRPKILISYRRGHEKFAEAVAHRLGKEGLTPLFDQWESLAGDSIPGKIAEWLAESVGCVIVVTSDYKDGPWATVEFEAAISKRAAGGYTLVPLLLEKCALPELLKYIQYVDFSNQDKAEFESKMAEVINAIYRIELNPYR